MSSIRSCLFGGAIFAAGITANDASAQCDPQFRSEITASSYAYSASDYQNTFTGAAIAGDRLYVAQYLDAYGSSGYIYAMRMLTFDISDTAAPALIGTSELLPMQRADTSEFATGTSLAVDGSVVTMFNAFQILRLDMTNPNAPTQVSFNSVSLNGGLSGVTADGGIYYMTAGDLVLGALTHRVDMNAIGTGNVDEFDISNVFAIAAGAPGVPSACLFPSADRFGGVTPMSYLFLQDLGCTPTADTTLTTTDGRPPSVTLVGDLAVIPSTVSGLSQLQLVDITDPAAGVLLPPFPNPGPEAWSAVGTDLIVGVDNADNMHLITLSNPLAPFVTSQTSPPQIDNTDHVLTAGNLICVVGPDDIELFELDTCVIVPQVVSTSGTLLLDHNGPPGEASVLAGGALTYQWHKDGVPVADGPLYSGATTDTISITAKEAATGLYTCEAINGGESDISDPIIIAVRPNPCVADCDENGVLNVDDIDCYVAGFLSGCP